MQLPQEMIELGKEYQVAVIKILDRGIVVQLKDTQYTEFIHISKLSTRYVSDIHAYVKVGDEFSALCIQGDGKRELSLKHLQLAPIYENAGSKKELTEEDSNTKTKSHLDEMIAASNLSLMEKLNTMQARAVRKHRK